MAAPLKHRLVVSVPPVTISPRSSVDDRHNIASQHQSVVTQHPVLPPTSGSLRHPVSHAAFRCHPYNGVDGESIATCQCLCIVVATLAACQQGRVAMCLWLPQPSGFVHYMVSSGLDDVFSMSSSFRSWCQRLYEQRPSDLFSSNGRHG